MSHLHKLPGRPWHLQGKAAILAAASCAVVGACVLVAALATGAYGAATFSTGQLAGDVKVVAAPSASDGYAVEFGVLTTTPAPMATPTAAPTVSPTPTPTPSATPPVDVRTLPSDPITTQLEGTDAVEWAEACLQALNDPTTSANIQTITTWFLNEATPHDLNNPINLYTAYGGSTDSTADGGKVSDNDQAYPIPADFVAAFAIQMQDGDNPQIVADFKSGAGFINSTNQSIKTELSDYSGGGYDSIPASYLNGKLGAS